MKIIYHQGDALEAPELVVAHGCNTLGVMGAGIALAVKLLYPTAYTRYRAGELKLGSVQFVPIDNTRTIANCMTQPHSASDEILGLDYQALSNCMWDLNRQLQHIVPAVAMPRIGAGLGGGDWSEIERIIEAELTHVQPVVYTL